jgi:hypothetical protein
MRALLAVVGIGAALVACAPSQDAATPDPTSTVSSMAPGQYRTTVTYTAVPTPLTDEQCVTSADIAELVRGSIGTDDAQACSENTLNTANGRIDGRVVCLDPTGSPRTMEVAGTYANNRADMDLTVTGSENGETVTRQGRVAIERTGECS